MWRFAFPLYRFSKSLPRHWFLGKGEGGEQILFTFRKRREDFFIQKPKPIAVRWLSIKFQQFKRKRVPTSCRMHFVCFGCRRMVQVVQPRFGFF